LIFFLFIRKVSKKTSFLGFYITDNAKNNFSETFFFFFFFSTFSDRLIAFFSKGPPARVATGHRRFVSGMTAFTRTTLGGTERTVNIRKRPKQSLCFSMGLSARDR